MLVKLLRDSRISHKAGDIVEVSPAEGGFLLSVGSAETVNEAPAEKAEEKPKRATRKKK